MDLVTVSKYVDKSWLSCPMKDIKKGDVFKVDSTQEIFEAKEDARFLEFEKCWGLECNSLEDLGKKIEDI